MSGQLPSRSVSSSSRSKSRVLKRSDFDIQSLLGEGTLSRVYLAINSCTQRRVALKVIAKQRVTTEAIVRSVLQERKALSLLDGHPNFVSLFSSFQDETFLYFELEYVPGGSLLDVLGRYEYKISQALVFYWACDIVEILEHLRSKKIVHRDIKPDNLLLDEHRRLRLIDFNNAIFLPAGVSTLTSSSPSKQNNEQGCPSASCAAQEEPVTLNPSHASELFGALHYLPPEVMLRTAPKLFAESLEFEQLYSRWRENNPAVVELLERPVPGYAIDVWSSGCVLFEAFCGYHPFKGTSDIDTVFNVLTYSMAAPPAFLGDTALDFLNRLLHRDPVLRLGAHDVSEFRNHPLFANVDLGVISEHTKRPPFYDTSSATGADATALAQVAAVEECLEFTPDLGDSFLGAMAPVQPKSLETLGNAQVRLSR